MSCLCRSTTYRTVPRPAYPRQPVLFPRVFLHSSIGEAALHVPELLKADVGGEAGLGDVVIKQLQRQPVADNGGLADGDVGEGAGVDQHGLMLHGVAHGGVDAVAHPGGHGAGDLQVLGGHGLALAVVSHHDLADPLDRKSVV